MAVGPQDRRVSFRWSIRIFVVWGIFLASLWLHFHWYGNWKQLADICLGLFMFFGVIDLAMEGQRR